MSSAISDNVITQFWLLVASFMAGILIMLIYDGFRAIRRVSVLKKRQKKKQTMKKWKNVLDIESKYVETEESLGTQMWVHLEDLIFWIFYVIVTYRVIYFYNYGNFSLYVILGELAGLCLYYLVFHNWIRCLCTCILWQIYTIIMWICHFFLLIFCGICAKTRKVLKLLIKCLRMISINN